MRWLRVFDVLGNSFGVGLQARGFDVGVGGWLTVVYVMDGRGGGIPALFPKCLWKFVRLDDGK